MIEVYIGNAFEPRKVITSPEKTVRQLYQENNIPISSSAIVTHGSTRLGDKELDRTLSELGVQTGALLTFTQKLNGARK
jgi:hypothetical protein